VLSFIELFTTYLEPKHAYSNENEKGKTKPRLWIAKTEDSFECYANSSKHAPTHLPKQREL
jgi:hypothetical protein